MAKKIKLSEEQYRMAVEEGVIDSMGNVSTSGKPKQIIPVEKTNTGSLDNNFKNAKNKLKNPNDPDTQFVIVDKTQNAMATESYVISKKDLAEHRLKALKEHSDMYTLENFMRKINET